MAEVACYSACTTVFLGGKYRVITIGTRLGFHLAAFPGLSEGDIYAIQKNERNFLLRKGVPHSFLDKVKQVPNNDMWYPNYRDLMNYNIVTHIKFGGKYVKINQYCKKSNCDNFSTAPRWLQEIAAQVNLDTPKKIDKITTLFQAIAGPDKNFTYKYILPFDHKINFSLLDSRIRLSGCSNKNMGELFDKGITVHWRYETQSGDFIHETMLTAKDCNGFAR